MRALLLVVLLSVLLFSVSATACNGSEEQRASESTNAPAADATPTQDGDDELARLVPSSEELPPALGDKDMRTFVISPDKYFRSDPAPSEPTADEIDEWRVSKVVSQFYSFRDEEQAFQSPVLATVDVSVHENIAGATAYAEYVKLQFDEQVLSEQETLDGGLLTQFEELSGSSLGEDSLLVRYINANPGGPARHEEYRVVFRRSAAVARIELGAPEGYFDMRQLMLALASAVDARLVAGDL